MLSTLLLKQELELGMVAIINPGGPGDTKSIALDTRKGNHINNERRLEWQPEMLRRAVADLRAARPDADLRSATAVYNCVGMVFAARRTCIDPDQLSKIFVEDEYSVVHRWEDAKIGDVVIYKDGNGIPQHVAVISNIEVNIVGPPRIMVISQWGAMGEYIHEMHYVPHLLGRPSECWTDRKDL